MELAFEEPLVTTTVMDLKARGEAAGLRTKRGAIVHKTNSREGRVKAAINMFVRSQFSSLLHLDLALVGCHLPTFCASFIPMCRLFTRIWDLYNDIINVKKVLLKNK